MTNKRQEAIEALDNIESYYSSAISNPPYQEELDIIREALSRPQVDIGRLKTDYDEPLGFYYADFCKEHVETLLSHGWNNCIEYLDSQGYLSPPSDTVVRELWEALENIAMQHTSGEWEDEGDTVLGYDTIIGVARKALTKHTKAIEAAKEVHDGRNS